MLDSQARELAAELDRRDQIGWLRQRFWLEPDGPIYLDGNSLGRLPLRSLDRVDQVMRTEWGGGLVGSWDGWIDLPSRVGDELGQHFLGAAPGQVVLADATTVNLFKLASAALDARPDRSTIVSDRGNFPTDRYLLEGLAKQRGLRLDLVDFPEVEGPNPDLVAKVISDDTALLALSHVDYRSGALADMTGINRVAHSCGAMVLWDLCHSVGAVPVELDSSGSDLAAGCTYKYLNAGPGSPAFLYVRAELQASLGQPIWGWFGQTNQFAMGQGYQPVAGLGRFQSGSPNVIGIALVEEGVELLAEAGIQAVREKSLALTSLLIELHDAWLANLGFELMSPRDPSRRGSQVTLRHPEAYRVCRAMIAGAGVIADFRAPDRLRLGCAAPTTSFGELCEAVIRIRQLVQAGRHLAEAAPPSPRT